MRDLYLRIKAWWMTPVIAATDIKRRVIFRLLRSRFFLLVAAATTIPALATAIGTSVKIKHPPPGGGLWLLWILATLQWVYYLILLLTAVSEYVARFSPFSRRRRSCTQPSDKASEHAP